jgi:hypothetical protein
MTYKLYVLTHSFIILSNIFNYDYDFTFANTGIATWAQKSILNRHDHLGINSIFKTIT